MLSWTFERHFAVTFIIDDLECLQKCVDRLVCEFRISIDRLQFMELWVHLCIETDLLEEVTPVISATVPYSSPLWLAHSVCSETSLDFAKSSFPNSVQVLWLFGIRIRFIGL